MSAPRSVRRTAPLSVVAIAGLIAWAILAPRSPSDAMPNFAQAYGVDCNTCHTQVPMLNAYGRYLQRTAYSSLNRDLLKKALPVWLAVNTSYDTQDPQSPHQVKFGNVALHAAGSLGQDFTYHAHQWIVQGENPGGVDTLWVSYNNLFKRNGHLFVGKIEAPGPSAFQYWTDISPFAAPSLAVGEHVWQNDANRWGAKLAYTNGPTNLEAAYMGADTDLNGATDWNPVNGKAFQYRAAWALPTKPFEIGIYGNTGTVPLAEGGVDVFNSMALYAQRDPLHGVPGFLGIYQKGHDQNPGEGLGPATSTAYSLELYQPFFKDRILLGLRKEMTDDGLGTVTHTGNVDLTFRLGKYVRLYTEAGMAQNQPPAWRWFVWWTTPLAPAPK